MMFSFISLSSCILIILLEYGQICCGYYQAPGDGTVPQLPSYRTVFYPMRTNCQNRCYPQTRYQWFYRPASTQTGIPYAPLPSTYIQPPALPIPVKYPYQPPPLPLPTLLPPPPPPPPPSSPTTTTTVPAYTEVYTNVSFPENSLATLESMREIELLTPSPFSPPNQNVPTKKLNPCQNGHPLTNEFQNPVTCNFMTKPNGGCPDKYWCHTGSSFETTTCCPNFNIKERCNLVRTNGEGDDLIPRWYYDVTLRKCKRFLYKGMKGNPNNFITSIQCMETCETADRASTYKNPCASGPPARNLKGELFRCGPYNLLGNIDDTNDKKNKCPAGYYCHMGESIETMVCCEVSSVRDQCLLSVSEGEGNANLPRFYYDFSTQKCTEFVYKGIRGNENNFLSHDDCEKACIKFSNPCPVLFDDNTQRKECSSNRPDICEKHEWCHIGSSPQTTLCCPAAVMDPCKLPLDVGQGTENFTRWYADPIDSTCNRECRPFEYRGTKGNQNNFLSKFQCELACKPDCFNPCSSGEMLLEPSIGRPKQCNDTSPCPVNYWCHYGANVETTVCCTAVKRACGLPMEEGFGKAVLSRWYYNKRDQDCKKFIYKGMGGNQNNYLNKDECSHACTAVDNPCSGGYPLMVANNPKICNPEHRCPSTHFCHIGADGVPNFCCPKNGDPCEHVVSPGTGPHAIQRFYFDRDTRRCSEFMYKGSKGNANNFLSMEDCELVCQMPQTRNPCVSGTPLLDDATNEAIICGGEEQCPAGYWCHIGGSPDTTNCCSLSGTKKVCNMPLNVGQGSMRLDRWYFDTKGHTCRRFTYNGLKGNANSFLSLQACQEACQTSDLNPCLVGKPLTNKDGEVLICQPDKPLDSCPASTHYCHASANIAIDSVCCSRTDNDACELPPNYGVGSEPVKRWYHNSARNKCEIFQYAGTRGNENNFISKEACEQNCPNHRKLCPHGAPLLDKRTSEPIQCGVTKSCPHGYVCHMDSQHGTTTCCEDPGSFCLHARDPGPCEKEEERYGYNPLTDTCVPYAYGGCGGTLNNFKTLERCTEICCREYRHKFASKHTGLVPMLPIAD